MPIYEIQCQACSNTAEVIVLSSSESLDCPVCGSDKVVRLMSPTSSLTGQPGPPLPGPKDSACCGSSPAHASCAGPGSCCGKMN